MPFTKKSDKGQPVALTCNDCGNPFEGVAGATACPRCGATTATPA